MTILFPQLIPYGDFAVFLLRLVVAGVFLTHGLPKLKNYQVMSQGMGMPFWFVLGLGVVECASALAMVLGVYTQVAALLLSIVMVGAIYFKMMKWNIPFAAHDKTGWEFDLTLLAANIALLFTGGGSIGIL